MSKKNPNATSDALVYLARRDLSPAHGSTLKKLLRAARISAGLRPLRRAKRQFFPVGVYLNGGSRYLVEKAADLHFTKGYRVAPGVPLKLTKLPAPAGAALAA